MWLLSPQLSGTGSCWSGGHHGPGEWQHGVHPVQSWVGISWLWLGIKLEKSKVEGPMIRSYQLPMEAFASSTSNRAAISQNPPQLLWNVQVLANSHCRWPWTLFLCCIKTELVGRSLLAAVRQHDSSVTAAGLLRHDVPGWWGQGDAFDLGSCSDSPVSLDK